MAHPRVAGFDSSTTTTQWRPWPALLLLLLSSTQQLRSCLAASLCGMRDVRTALVADRLFFMSGNYTFDDSLGDLRTTSSLYWLELGEQALYSNNVNFSSPIDMSALATSEMPDEALRGGGSSSGQGVFFFDRTVIYPYAGLTGAPEDHASETTLWGFNTSDDTWSSQEVGWGGIPFANNSDGVSATYAGDDSMGYSFYTGGTTMSHASSSDDDANTNATIQFTSFNGAGAPQWAVLEQNSGGIQGPNMVGGDMVYIRKGQSGVLLAFGGYNTAYRNETAPGGSGYDMHPMDKIWIFDAYLNRWYTQTATAAGDDDVPTPRRGFCAGVAAADDDSSFQVYVYGGWDEAEGRALSDVWILSVPSFRWIRADDTTTETDTDRRGPGFADAARVGRVGASCEVVNNRALVVAGGQVWDNDEERDMNEACNADLSPVKVYDMAEQMWLTEDYYLEDMWSSYSVPDVVTDVIGGYSYGYADMTTPQNGWDSPELQAVFNETIAGPTPTPTPYDYYNNGYYYGYSYLSDGQIAGIVISGIIVVSAIAFGIWACCRKRKGKEYRPWVIVVRDHDEESGKRRWVRRRGLWLDGSSEEQRAAVAKAKSAEADSAAAAAAAGARPETSGREAEQGPNPFATPARTSGAAAGGGGGGLGGADEDAGGLGRRPPSMSSIEMADMMAMEDNTKAMRHELDLKPKNEWPDAGRSNAGSSRS